MYYSCPKPSIQDKQRKNQHPNNPSFSSILLDEIFHSIDGNEQNPNKHVRNQTSRRPNNVVDYVKIKTKTKTETEPEEIACKKRAWLVEKKVSSLQEFDNLGSLQDNDHMFFSTSSSSCSETSSGGLSSSDAEIFYSSSTTTKSRNVTSCFTSSKPNKAAATTRFPPRPRQSNYQDSSNYKRSECYMFDDFSQNQYVGGGNQNEDNLIKSRSRAMKMYNNLKKVKQPISPGGRLTSFISSFFASGNSKKSKDEVKYASRGGKPSSTNASTCSSASSFSRSCMSKSVPNSKGKFDEIPYRKTVHFCPVNVIVDEDDDEFDRFKKLPGSYEIKSYPTNCSRLSEYDKHGSYRSSETLKTHVLDRNKRIDQEAAKDVLLKAGHDEDHDDDYEEEDVDGFSDCSSDLFEINHLEVFGNTRFCEELPVYGTTHLDRNRAIPRGLNV